QNPNLTNKLAIVLLDVNVTGNGTTPMYVQGLKIEAQINNDWIVGKHVVPQYFGHTNEMGFSEKGVHVAIKEPEYKLTGFLSRWKEIGSENAPLQYGQSTAFCYAAIFNARPEDFDNCRKLRVTVNDYLGHEYTRVIAPTIQMKERARVACLVLDAEVSSKA